MKTLLKISSEEISHKLNTRLTQVLQKRLNLLFNDIKTLLNDHGEKEIMNNIESEWLKLNTVGIAALAGGAGGAVGGGAAFIFGF